MEKLEFKSNDITGASTLEVISKADKFNQWMYDTIKPFCKGNILEIGSGIGNISSCFLRDNFKIRLTDISEGYCEKLNETFSSNSSFQGAETMDLTDPDFDSKFSKYSGKFDTVFALNVVEHIYEDVLALQNCKKLLSPGGNVVILVPSYQALYNQFDTELDHYRRYTISSLSRVFQTAEIEIIHKQYFNFVGIFGWYISGSILKKKSIPENQMSLYNSLVPLFKKMDKLVLNQWGLSTLIVGKKS